MKTTVDITDPLLEEAKRFADANGLTLRQVIEDGLRLVLETRRPRRQFKLRDASVDGGGLQPGIEGGTWSDLRDRIYEWSGK
jgi:hypothetical protein